MAYDVTLVQVNAAIFGFQASNTDMGFGTSAFDYLLFSAWTCLPWYPSVAQTSDGGPAYISFLGMNIDGDRTTLALGNQTSGVTLFTGSYNIASLANVRANHLISVDCTRNLVQYYANDQLVTITTGGWVTSGSFQVKNNSNVWDFDVGSSGGVYPAFADLWLAAPGAFVDLSLVGNRRKFINRDLSPVDLGANGTNPLGSTPQIFQTATTGGVPDDFLTNQGLGDDFTLNVGNTLSFQTPDTCSLPPPPPPLPGRPMISIIGKSLP